MQSTAFTCAQLLLVDQTGGGAERTEPSRSVLLAVLSASLQLTTSITRHVPCVTAVLTIATTIKEGKTPHPVT